MAKYTALDVAAWILARARLNQLEGSDDPSDMISNIKLQKLLYYAQGC